MSIKIKKRHASRKSCKIRIHTHKKSKKQIKQSLIKKQREIRFLKKEKDIVNVSPDSIKSNTSQSALALTHLMLSNKQELQKLKKNCLQQFYAVVTSFQ